jgi:hypothetical protein
MLGKLSLLRPGKTVAVQAWKKCHLEKLSLSRPGKTVTVQARKNCLCPGL